MRIRGTAVIGVSVFAATILGVMQLRVAAQGGTSASARNSSNTVANVFWFHAPGHVQGTPVVASSSTMIRNAEAVSYTLDTNGLMPGDAATNWWIVFNNPQFCSPPGC